jgi:putative ABC transport system ATP-binding protein
VIADEPTGNLDSVAGDAVMSLLARLNADGATVVIVTHDASVAASAGRRITIKDGRIYPERTVASPPAQHSLPAGPSPRPECLEPGTEGTR